ncbi:unnamed protein product [Dicrocoelium dendriticum]|nr:unnamed protein product [Dicrocoelium dendriticum]
MAFGRGERLGVEREVDLDAIILMKDQVVEGHSISGDNVDVRDGYVCFHGAAFGTKRWLGQHKRNGRPVELNEKRLRMIPRRGHCSEKDATRLLAQTSQYLPECANRVEVYHRLAAQFPGRSVEGIMKQLMKMRWPRRRPNSEVGAELTESELVPDRTTTIRDPDQTEATLEPNDLRFSYDEQFRSFLENPWCDSDPAGVFGELVDLIPPNGEEAASSKLALEATKSPM